MKPNRDVLKRRDVLMKASPDGTIKSQCKHAILLIKKIYLQFIGSYIMHSNTEQTLLTLDKVTPKDIYFH